MTKEKNTNTSNLSFLEKKQVLKQTSLFSETPDSVLDDMVNILHIKTYQAGDSIFYKGNIGNSMYIIYRGEIRIHEDDHTFAILKKGNIFGELSLLDPEPRSATATVLQNCLVFMVAQKDFYEIASKRPEIMKGILTILARRLRSQNKHVVNLKGQVSWMFSKFHDIY
ncbi:MAG: Crp/Fnr family transcriptional regulator [Chitinophagales bacterium]